MSNKYSDQLMQALDIAIDEKISTLQFDKTIQATVQSVVDLDTGEYRVKYKDGIISAFAANPKETFKQGDAVYVTVPESDFSNKKFISHRITNNSLSTGQYSELANTIFEVSPNFSDLGYIYISPSSKGYTLTVGGNSSINILRSAPALANSRFKAYADQYEYIQISASFLNEFTQDHIQGDYGIELVLTNIDDQQVSYFLNLNDFNGDPYHLATWSPQSTVVKIPKGQIKALNAIYFYESGFVSEGNIANLFMSDFSLNFVDKVDLTEIPYYLNILPLDGVAFTTSSQSLRLEGHVYNKGEELSESSCSFQWFERDLSIAPGDLAYDKRAGWGWKAIAGATNKLLIVSNPSGSIWQKNFKLIVVYNSTTLMTKEITLFKGVLDTEIEQVTQGDEIHLKLTKDSYVGDWYYLTADGNQVAIPQSPRSGISPNIVSFLLYSPMTFYCQVYQGNTYIGELSYVMQNIESKDDVSVVFIGPSLFSYDANGDYGNIYDTHEEKTLSMEIIWRNGVISSSSKIVWLDFEGNPIRTNLDDPSPYGNNSMIRDVWVDTVTNILHYKINNKYKETLSKYNSFSIQISTINGQIYNFDKEIVFIKTGDPGTNGTKYQSLITIENGKFVDVIKGNSSVTLKCQVYKDSDIFIIEHSENIVWELFNLTAINPITKDNKIIGETLKVKANNDKLKRYVKVTITINDSNESNQSIVLYNFFAVDSCASQPNINLSELPKYIQYASNGRNPQCRTQVPVISFEGSEANITSLDEENLVIKNNKFIPNVLFDPENNVGLLKIVINNIEIYHPVPMYINTFGNEAINGWDGIEVSLGDNPNHSIFAPQVGAGIKNSNNAFTGVVMGKDSAQQKIGLYGYQAGKTAFALMEDGKAFFGKAGQGRIEINGDDATISGGGGGKSLSGMTITLANKDADKDSNAIEIGKGNFIVTYGGQVTANGATVRGILSAGADSRIGCTFNTNGTPKNDGWLISEHTISSGSVYLYSGSDKFTRGYAWRLTKDCPYYKINSKHTAIIGEAQTKTSNTKVILTVFETIPLTVDGTEGNYVVFKFADDDDNEYCSLTSNVPATSYYRIWSGSSSPSSANFIVTSSGHLVANSAEITGLIKAKTGYIGGETGWTVDSNKIYGVKEIEKEDKKENKYVALSTSGQYALFAGASSNDDTGGDNAPFSVMFDGSLKATAATIQGEITATKGAIGNWKINSADDGALRSSASGQSTRIYLDGSATENNKALFISYTASPSTDSSNYTSGTNGYFYVTANGKMYAQAAEIKGTIKSNDGEIGGWTINKSGLKKNDNIYIYSNGSMKLGNNFAVDDKGNVTIKGDVTAKAGYIGWQDDSNKGWAITANRIYSNSVKYVGLASNGTYAIWAGDETASSAPFSVTHAGKVIATDIKATGIITANSGRIAGWVIKGNKLQVRTSATDSEGSNNLYLDGGPWDANDNNKYVLYMHSDSGTFSVKSSGIMSATGAVINGNITAKTGNIGGWSLSDSRLYASNTGRIGLAQRGVQVYDANGNAINGQRLVFWSGVKYTKTGDDTGNATGSESGLYLRGDNYFGVSSSGKLYCNGAEISGKIVIGPGSEIDGGYIKDGTVSNGKITSISGDKITTGTISTDRLNADSIKSEIVQTTNLSADRITSGIINTNRLNTTALQSTIVTASYINTLNITAGSVAAENITGTTITGKIISGGTISGASILGGFISSDTNIRAGKYQNITGTCYFEVGDSSYGDFRFKGNGDNYVFKIIDGIDHTEFYAFDHKFLSYSASSETVFLHGTWNLPAATFG